MSNCMKNIAEGLGVKLNEVFLIDDDKYMIRDYFRITENDLEYDFRRQFSSSSWCSADNKVLVLLVTGKVEITKLPWTPKKMKSIILLLYLEKVYLPAMRGAEMM